MGNLINTVTVSVTHISNKLYHRLWKITWLAQWKESCFHKVLFALANSEAEPLTVDCSCTDARNQLAGVFC